MKYTIQYSSKKKQSIVETKKYESVDNIVKTVVLNNEINDFVDTGEYDTNQLRTTYIETNKWYKQYILSFPIGLDKDDFSCPRK